MGFMKIEEHPGTWNFFQGSELIFTDKLFLDNLDITPLIPLILPIGIQNTDYIMNKML